MEVLTCSSEVNVLLVLLVMTPLRIEGDCIGAFLTTTLGSLVGVLPVDSDSRSRTTAISGVKTEKGGARLHHDVT